MRVSSIKQLFLVFSLVLSNVLNAQVNEQEVGNNATAYNLSSPTDINFLAAGVK